MDWDNLKYFLALAEAGSLSRASEKLQVTHSTVARRIALLEKALSVRLVERRARSYHLTAEGERVRELAKGLENGIADIARFAHSADPSRNRVVRVNGPPALITRFLAPRLLPLQKEHRGLRIELVGEVRKISLARGEADIALRMERPREKGIVARRLAVVAYGLYGSRAYLAGSSPGTRDFVGYDDSLDHLPQQRWLKKLAGNRALALRANDLVSLLAAVRGGLGLAVLPCPMARGEPDLAKVPTPAFTRELWILFHRDVARAPAVRAVIDRITAIVTDAKENFLGVPG